MFVPARVVPRRDPPPYAAELARELRAVVEGVVLPRSGADAAAGQGVRIDDPRRRLAGRLRDRADDKHPE